MAVLIKPHERPFWFLTMRLKLSIQLSNCLSTLNINFNLLLPVHWLPVTVIVVISELTPTVLHLELSHDCRVFLICLSLLTKPPLVFQITVRVCLSVTSTVAKQLTAHPSVQVTFLQTKCTSVVTVDSSHSCYLYFGATSLNAILFLLAPISSTFRYFLNYQLFSSRRTHENISV
jgi:hypothetical protein